jgi:hypothetical protein
MGFRVAGFEFAPHYLTSKLGSVMSTVKCVDACIRASHKMARGVASPAPTSLPRVSFVKVVGEDSATRSGVHDNQQRSYGCASIRFSPAHLLTGV